MAQFPHAIAMQRPSDFTPLAFYYLDANFSSPEFHEGGIAKILSRIVVPALLGLEDALAAQIGAKFSLTDYTFVLCCDRRNTNDPIDQIVTIRAYDVYDCHSFMCGIYEESNTEANGHTSFFTVGPGPANLNSLPSNAVRVLYSHAGFGWL